VTTKIALFCKNLFR